MRLKDTGLTVADVKAMAQKYQIETYERMDFLVLSGTTSISLR